MVLTPLSDPEIHRRLDVIDQATKAQLGRLPGYRCLIPCDWGNKHTFTTFYGRKIESKSFFAVLEQNPNPSNPLIHQCNCPLSHRQNFRKPRVLWRNLPCGRSSTRTRRLVAGMWRHAAGVLAPQLLQPNPNTQCNQHVQFNPHIFKLIDIMSTCPDMPRHAPTCPDMPWLFLLDPFGVEVLNNPKYANLSM